MLGFLTEGTATTEQKKGSRQMSHSMNYQAMINRGRKAGLNTRDLYSAMASVHVDNGAQGPGQADGNGFISTVNQEGQQVYRPVGGTPRS